MPGLDISLEDAESVSSSGVTATVAALSALIESGNPLHKDGQLWTYLNGALITHVTKHPFTEAGYIGFQVESGPVHWRNIRISTD